MCTHVWTSKWDGKLYIEVSGITALCVIMVCSFIHRLYPTLDCKSLDGPWPSSLLLYPENLVRSVAHDHDLINMYWLNDWDICPTSYSSIIKAGCENSGWESHTTVTNRIPILDWQVSMVNVLVPHPPPSCLYSQPLLARTVHEAAGWYSFQHSRVLLDRKPPLSQKKQNCKMNKWEIHHVSVCLLDD